MNETRGNARTKQMREPLKEREMNSLKDSEKTNELRIKGCLLHNSDLWKTPKKIYDHYIKLNYFDPCPSNPNFDGLKIDWKSKNFVNPPYSQISKWIEKAIEEKKRHCNSVFLIPARTDTKWFRKLIETGAHIIFLQGRLHFDDKGPAPFPSMIVYINAHSHMYNEYFEYFTKEDIENYFI